MQKVFSAVFLTVCFLAVLAGAAGFYMITTESAGRAAAQFLIKRSAPAGMTVTVGNYTGTISTGMTLQDVGINGIPGFPSGSSLLIQRLIVHVPVWDPVDFSLNIFNGRLSMPGCEPVIIEGEYAKGNVQGRAYTRVLDVHTLVSSVMQERYLKNLRGFFTAVRVLINGPAPAPRINGTFFVDRVQYQGTTVSQGPGRVEAVLSFFRGRPSLSGDLMMESGMVNTRDRDIDLLPSKAMFRQGDLTNPALDIRGNTQVANISIDLSIKGTLFKPELKLRSDPPLSEDVLWAVLAGGKTWVPAMEASEESRKLDLKKQLTDDLKIGFELEQMPPPLSISGSQEEYSKKLEGEMSLTDKLSVNVGQQILRGQNSSDLPATDPVADSHRQNASEIFFKYKKTF